MSTSSTFKWHNLAQFFGALNDNLFRYYIIFFLIGIHGKDSAERISADIGVVFAIPFLVFIAFAGVIADRFSKSRVVFLIKCAECMIMLFGVLAFYLEIEAMLYVLMFLMASQSAFFSPTKFSIVPELVPQEQISRANSYMQALTYLSIIIGTSLAPLVIRLCDGDYTIAAIFCVGFAGIGVLCSKCIQSTPPANPEAKFSPLFLVEIWKSIQLVRKDAFLFLAVLSSAYFLFIASYCQLNVIPYGLKELGIPMEQRESAVYMFLFAAVGIGIGSLLAGRLSGRSVEFGIVPLGALLMTVGSVGLNFCPRTTLGAGTFFVIFGLGGGLFIVPVQAFIQLRAPREKLGEILAATSFLSWIGVIIASQLLKFLDQVLHFTPGQGFMVLGVATMVMMVFAFIVLPDFFFRFLAATITRACYRINVIGGDRLPAHGPALVVCNHAALIDAAVLQATTPRRMRFLMSRAYFENAPRWMKPILRLARVILVHEEDNPKAILRSLKTAREALDDGYLVVIFAEGHITRNGLMHEFKPGFERIVRKSDYPIIPTYLGGAWGSMYSYYYGGERRKLPAKFPYPISVVYGDAMPSDSSPFLVQQAVRELSAEYFEDRKKSRRSLATEWIHTARGAWGRRALKDSMGKDLTHGQTLTAVVALAKVIEPRLGANQKVGVLMPTTAAGALVNLSLAMLDRIAVNLNYTASSSAFESAIRQCELDVIITTRPFLEKLPDLPLCDQVLYLEDLSAELRKSDKLRALVKARCYPVSWLTGVSRFNPDDLATIIFSSGSTAEPKGVMLSHHNILSNVESLRAIMLPTRDDNVCAALPFFHSFGFTCTLWFPLLSGFSASYHTSPLEGAKIAELARESRSTILVATPTFLLAYIRRAKPEDFKHLRLVFVGAEKLKPRIAEAFEKKFGLRPLEGYGATELSPVAAGSVHDVSYDGFHQKGWQEGSVGQPLAGMVFRVVDPDTGERLPPDTPGLLMVKGPNVMQGYLKQEAKTAEVLKDGWYNTGDIAVLQKDGFVRITDRLARFSKIAGEMVPHAAIEEVVQTALAKTEPVVAVTSMPDERKGERLVLFYVETVVDEAGVNQIIKESSLPNLWKPSIYIAVEGLPMLGTGKLDLKGLKALALARTLD